MVARGAALVAVRQGRLIAMVAVGDVQRLVGEQVGDAPCPRAADRRDAVRVAVAVAGHARAIVGRLVGRGRQLGSDGAAVVGVEEEDLAQVGMGGAVQIEAVHLGARVGLLVREHDAVLEVGEPQPGDEAAARALVAVGPPVDLVDQIDGRLGIAHQHAVRPPAAERGRGRGVGRRAALFPRADGKVDVQGVVRAACAERRGLRCREHVVGRCDDRIHVCGVAVAEATEGCHVRHRRRGSTGG